MSLKFLSNQTTDNKIGIGTNVPNANLEVSFPDNTNIQRWSYSPAKTDYYLELDSYIPTGGVVGYDSDITSGGLGARVLGIQANKAFRKDIVTIILRLVNVQTGEVIITTTIEKTIISTSTGSDVFKYFASSDIAYASYL